ncbi:MAG: hypothetical protein JWN48_3138 [Myxococcaceae bacterium]|nr:hypothetical protein [Myxococcaceae bacterium]
MLKSVLGRCVTRFTPRELDPETVCTRVVARLIEELGCVDIAPDSPVWRDLLHDGQIVGELRVYRGRGRVQKVVSSRFALTSPPMDSHSVVIFTHPDSPVPHFGLDSVRLDSRVHLYVDLLPKRDLAVSLDYLDRCYVPLTEVQRELEQDTRFTPSVAPLRHRALLSPWHALYTLDPADLGAAEQYVDRYISHWASLLRSDAPELQSAPELAPRDAAYRKTLYSREVDPAWGMLDRAIGHDAVDDILRALST